MIDELERGPDTALEEPAAPSVPAPGSGAPPEPAGAERAPERAPARGGIRVEPGHHVCFLGQSRSGKTHLAKALLGAIPGRIIVDTKHSREDFNDPRWGAIVNTPEEMAAAWWSGQTQIVWQPPLNEVRKPPPGGNDSYGRGLRWIFEQLGDDQGRPSVTLYFDEGRWCTPTQPNPYIEVLVCQGMGRGIGVWVASQNPFYIFGNCLSDAVHVFGFRIQNKRDRGKIAGDIGIDAEVLGTLESSGPAAGEHEFVYWRQGTDDWLGPTSL